VHRPSGVGPIPEEDDSPGYIRITNSREGRRTAEERNFTKSRSGHPARQAESVLCHRPRNNPSQDNPGVLVTIAGAQGVVTTWTLIAVRDVSIQAEPHTPDHERPATTTTSRATVATANRLSSWIQWGETASALRNRRRSRPGTYAPGDRLSADSLYRVRGRFRRSCRLARTGRRLHP